MGRIIGNGAVQLSYCRKQLHIARIGNLDPGNFNGVGTVALIESVLYAMDRLLIKKKEIYLPVRDKKETLEFIDTYIKEIPSGLIGLNPSFGALGFYPKFGFLLNEPNELVL